MKLTPNAWEIEWYECKSDRSDVKAGAASKVGETLWRVPKSIGPVSTSENHWARDYIYASEADFYLVALAPELLNLARRISEYQLEGEGCLKDIGADARKFISIIEGAKE